MVARLRDAVRKMSLACGKAVVSRSPDGVRVFRRGSANPSAHEPRPWRMMNVWRWEEVGRTILGVGKTPSGIFSRGESISMLEVK